MANSVYAKPTKAIMFDFAKEKLEKGKIFDKQDAVDWFSIHFPKLNPNTIRLHVEGMAINNIAARKHHKNIQPNAGYDLFFKVGSGKFRLWDPETDPQPVYQGKDTVANVSQAIEGEPSEEENDQVGGASEFAFERDLRNYLSKNLSSLERGLHLYQDEEFNGIEFPVGGRFIDILAKNGDDFVVIELKVSRGYDRVIGQLLRYMAWVKANLASGKNVRGIIVASDITEDLKLASTLIPNVTLVEYEIAFKLRPVA